MEIVMYMCCWRRCSSALTHTLFRAYSSFASVSHLHCSPSSGLHTSVCVCLRVKSQLNRASDIWQKKSKILRDFQREIRGKIDWFRGKKSQNSRNNQLISQEKSQNSQKNCPISRDFSRKKVNFWMIFRGKLLEKSDIFTGNFGRKVRRETIDQFCVDMTSVGERFFFNRDNHLLFQQQFTREMSEC